MSALRKAIDTLEAATAGPVRDAELTLLCNVLARTEARTVKGVDAKAAVVCHERDAFNLANAIIGATS